MTEILAVLPILLKWLPALGRIIGDAVAGASHPDEVAWCAHIPGLEDVCRALRDGHGSTLSQVRGILEEVQPNELARALADLRRRWEVWT